MSADVGPLTVFGASLLVLALVTVLRSREADWPRARWFVASVLTLAGSTGVTIIATLVELPEATVLLRAAFFLASGLFLVAFRHGFAPCGPITWAFSGAGAGLAFGAVAATRPPLVYEGEFTEAQLAVVLVWAATVLSVGVSFWRLGRGRAPTQRVRMRTLAVAVVSLAVLITSLSAVNRGRTANVTFLIGSLGGVAFTALLGVSVSPPAWVRRMQGGASRERLRSDATRRIALATDVQELGRAAVVAAEELLGTDAAFLVVDDRVVAADGVNAAAVERLIDWSDGDEIERTVRIDEGEPVRVTLRRASSEGILGVISGPFSPIFGSDEGSQLDELATTVGVALTRVQLFEELRRQTERTQALLDAVSDLDEGVFVSDGRRFTEVNLAFAGMLNMTRSEVLRLPSVLDVLPERLRGSAEREQAELLSRLAQDRPAERFEAKMVRADGREILTAVAIRTLDTEDGLRFIGAVSDITASRRALRDQQRRAQHLSGLRQLESTVAGMRDLPALIDAVTEATGDLLRCGAVATRVLGREPSDDVAAQRGLEPEDAAVLAHALRSSSRLTPDRVVRPIDIDLASLELPARHPLIGGMGVAIPAGDELVGVVIVSGRTGTRPLDEIDRATLRDLASYVTEISQSVRAFAAQRAAADQLRRVDETRDLLLSAVSHDLRSPLSTIAAMARTLEIRGEEFEPAFRSDLAKRIHGQAVRLGRVVTDLLDMDRLRRGMLIAERRPLSLRDIVTASLEGVDRRDLERIATDVDDVVVNLDGPKVERVIENLVTNALRHTPEDSHIWITAHERGDEVRLTVEDDGPGIELELRERVFEPFERGPRTGFGLGLALVRRIAELHDGAAWLEERDGGGCRFVATFAHAPAHPETDALTTDDEHTTPRDR